MNVCKKGGITQTGENTNHETCLNFRLEIKKGTKFGN